MKFWTILKQDGSQVNHLTREQIVEGMKVGLFNPFDLVYSEESETPRPIIETVEIISPSPAKASLVKPLDPPQVIHPPAGVQNNEKVSAPLPPKMISSNKAEKASLAPLESLKSPSLPSETIGKEQKNASQDMVQKAEEQTQVLPPESALEKSRSQLGEDHPPKPNDATQVLSQPTAGLESTVGASSNSEEATQVMGVQPSPEDQTVVVAPVVPDSPKEYKKIAQKPPDRPFGAPPPKSEPPKAKAPNKMQARQPVTQVLNDANEPSVGANSKGYGNESGEHPAANHPPQALNRRTGERSEDSQSQLKTAQYFIIDDRRRAQGPFNEKQIFDLYDQGRLLPTYSLRPQNSSNEVGISSFIQARRGEVFFKPAPQVQPAKQSHYKSPRKIETYKHEDPSNVLASIMIFLIFLVIGGGVVWKFWLRPALRNTPNFRGGTVLTSPGKSKSGSSGVKKSSPVREGGKNRANEAVSESDASARAEEILQIEIKPDKKKKRRRSQRDRPTKVSKPAEQVKISSVIDNLLILSRMNSASITIGPLKFAPAALNSCQVKCSLVMHDSFGNTVVVKFFKAAYHAQLRGKGAGVYLDGRVQDGGKSFVLSGVR